MAEMDWKQFSQPYLGSAEDLQELLAPARTTAELADITNSINTTNKFAGKRCFEETLKLDYITDGPADDDAWYLNDGLGLTTVSPS